MARISRPKPMNHKAGYGKGSNRKKGGKIGKKQKC